MAIVGFNPSPSAGLNPNSFAGGSAGVQSSSPSSAPIATLDSTSAQLQSGVGYARDQFAQALQATASAGEAKPGPEPLGRAKPGPNPTDGPVAESKSGPEEAASAKPYSSPSEDWDQVIKEYREKMRPIQEKEMERRMLEMMRRQNFEEMLRR